MPPAPDRGAQPMRMVLSLALVIAAALAGAAAADARTLDDVRARGELRCGVNVGLAGFSAPDDKGVWRGLDVDFCRAIAAAIFKDASRVKYVPLSAKERFTALQSGEIDLLSRNTTWTMSRDTEQGLNFVGITYYDGQGFIVRKSLGVSSVSELAGASICMQTGTTNELNVADYFRTRGLSYNPVVFEKNEEAVAAYNLGRCDAYTTDSSGLYAQRIRLSDPEANVVLPEVISKEPLGPVVRQGDDQWANLVKWTLFAWLNAEELGIRQANVDEMRASPNPEVRRLLGVEGEFGRGIGLANDWAYEIVRSVGNYGESFERNVGRDSRLKIARGYNRLWTEGGLHYAPPIR
jgi:general L-amino acid transport system substrate-binding protein